MTVPSPRPTLVCMVGLPRSGKTTWARDQRVQAPIVNPDSIRLALHGQRFSREAEPFVWAIAKVMVRALFMAGHDLVILDACNVHRKRRDDWRSTEWTTAFAVIDTPLEVCLQRAAELNDPAIVPHIHRMYVEWQDLEEDEEAWPLETASRR